MKRHKVKQHIYNKTHSHDDFLGDISYKVEEQDSKDIISYCVHYFEKDIEPIFPAKSYAVAIIYSRLLEKYFDSDFYTNLDDFDLFLKTDKYFVPYSQNKAVYDEIIEILTEKNKWDFESSSIEQVAKTVNYFSKEFLWEER